MEKIILCGREMPYTLERKNVKNVNLRVRADGSLYVSANPRVPLCFIEEFLKRKERYIVVAADRAAASAPAEKTYADGELITLLGRQLTLCVEKGAKCGVTANENVVVVTVKNTENKAQIKKAFDNWLAKQCEYVVCEVCTSYFPLFTKVLSEMPKIRFRNMKSRWGSCRPTDRVLTFNIHLIETPITCIEYVVAHEFTHFLVPNHSQKFYRELERVMPDWKNRRKLLNTFNLR